MNPQRFLTKLVVLLLLTHSAWLESAHAEDEALQVRSSFKDYKNAVLTDDGKRAASLVASRTLDYYRQMKQLALGGSKEQVEGLNLMDRLMVFSLRHRVPASSLESMSAKDLFGYAVDQGWVGKESVGQLSIGKITVNGNTAKAECLLDEQPSPLNFIFYKEESTWRLDLLPVLQIANSAFEESLRNAGRDENDFLFEVIGETSGNRPDNSIWEPLKARP